MISLQMGGGGGGGIFAIRVQNFPYKHLLIGPVLTKIFIVDILTIDAINGHTSVLENLHLRNAR